MPTNKELEVELAFYFQHCNTDTISVYGDSEDDHGNKTNLEIVRIKRINTDNGVRYYIKKANQNPKEIHQEIFQRNELLKLIHRELKLSNDEIRHTIVKMAAQTLSSIVSTPSAQIKNIFSQEKANNASINQENIYHYQALKPSRWQRLTRPFSLINAWSKKAARWIVLDNIISKHVFGGMIAYIANRGNSHYKTKAQTVSETLGKLIFPAGLKRPNTTRDGKIFIGPVLTKQFEVLEHFDIEYGKYSDNSVFKPFKIQLDENTLLDGVEARNAIKKAADETLHVIYFNGNSGCYEASASHIEEQLNFFAENAIAAKAVLFNYPGVLKSQGDVKQAQDLITAGIAQVERLHQQQGIPYHKIALHGVSLGGSIAAHVAAFYQAKGIDLEGTYLAKTFSSTTNVGLSYIQKLPVVGGILGTVMRPIVAFGLWGSRWQIDTAKQYTSLPRDKRDYSVVRSNKKTREGYQPKDDSVLFHQTSLHESWRLKLQRFFHKRGWFGYDKASYKSINHARKMSVYFIEDEDHPATLAPSIDGHTTASHMLRQKPGPILYHRGVGADTETTQVLHPANPSKGIPEKLIKVGQEASQRACAFFIAQEKKESEEIDSETKLTSLTTVY